MLAQIIGLLLILSQNAFSYTPEDVQQKEMSLQQIAFEMRDTYGVKLETSKCLNRSILNSCLKLAQHLLRGHEEMTRKREEGEIKTYILLHNSDDNQLEKKKGTVKIYHKTSRISISVSSSSQTAVFQMPFLFPRYNDFSYEYVKARSEGNNTPFYEIVSLAQFQTKDGPGFFSKWPLY